MPDRVRAHPHAEALQSPASLIGPLAARRNGEQDRDGRRTAEQLPQLDRRRTVSRSTICRRHGMTTKPPGRRREGRGLPCAAGCGERQWRRPRCGPRRAWLQAGGRDIEHDRGGVLPAVAPAARRGLRGEVEEQPLGLERQRRLAGAALSTGERITRIGACTVLPRSAAGTFSLAWDLKLEVERRTDGALATRRGTGLRSQGNSPGTAPPRQTANS